MAGMNPQMMNQMMQRFGGMGLGGGPSGASMPQQSEPKLGEVCQIGGLA